jgi:hypothetical protein
MCGGSDANGIFAVDEPPADPASPTIVGMWLSNWGPYTFVVEGTEIRGWYQQSPCEKATIRDGRYDPAKRQLTFNYFQSWNNSGG